MSTKDDKKEEDREVDRDADERDEEDEGADAEGESDEEGDGSDDEDEESDDEDEEADDEDEESDDEDEDEEVAAASERPGRDARPDREARRRELAHTAHDDGHDDHGHAHDDDEVDYSDDPSWWAPHAVLSALVLFGVLGFFGVFNKPLGFLAARPGGESAAHAETPKPSSQAAAPTPKPRDSGAPEAPRELFGAKHLLVMYKGGRRAPPNVERTKEEAKARATEALKKAKSGTKFEDLVKEYSDEPGAGQRGGDLGQFPKGAMVPEFQAGLEKTKVGEISDVVETPFGFHVIQRTK